MGLLSYLCISRRTWLLKENRKERRREGERKRKEERTEEGGREEDRGKEGHSLDRASVTAMASVVVKVAGAEGQLGRGTGELLRM